MYGRDSKQYNKRHRKGGLVKRIPEERIADFVARYPGRPVIRLPEENPEEVIIEIMQSSDKKFGIAVALILKTRPHKHLKTSEFYKILGGKVDIFLGDPQTKTAFTIDENDPGRQFIFLPPPAAHSAVAEELAEVLVISCPAWDPNDHILLKEEQAQRMFR